MSRPDTKFVVQDRESGLFLTPIEGDVGFTQWLNEAGRFDEAEEAVDTANLNCSAGYFITEVVS